MRPFCLQPPHAPHRRFLTLPLSAMGFPCGSGLRPWSVGSPKHQAESSSSVCGPVSHLRLLPTPPRGDAVIFGSRPESVGLKRICTSLNECAHGRTDRRRPRRRFSPESSTRDGDGLQERHTRWLESLLPEPEKRTKHCDRRTEIGAGIERIAAGREPIDVGIGGFVERRTRLSAGRTRNGAGMELFDGGTGGFYLMRTSPR